MARYSYQHISKEIVGELEHDLREEISKIDLPGIIRDSLKKFHIDIEDIDIQDKNFKLALERGLFYALNQVKRDIKVDMGAIDLEEFVSLDRDAMNKKLKELYGGMQKAIKENDKELARQFRDDFFAAMTVATANNIPFLKEFSAQWKKAYKDALDDIDQATQTRFQKLQIEIQSRLEDMQRAKIIAENTTAHLRQKGHSDEEIQTLLSNFPQLSAVAKNATKSQKEFQETVDDTNSSIDVNGKSLRELVELYQQLGTNGGTQKSLEEVSNAILNIVKAERQLDPDEMSRFTEILQKLTASGEGGDIADRSFSIDEAMKALSEVETIESKLKRAHQDNVNLKTRIDDLEEQLEITNDLSEKIESVNDDLRERNRLLEQERNTLSNNLEEEKEKTAELKEQNKLLEEQRNDAEYDAQHSNWLANEYANKAWDAEDELKAANTQIEELKDKLKDVSALSQNEVEALQEQAAELRAKVELLEEYNEYLRNNNIGEGWAMASSFERDLDDARDKIEDLENQLKEAAKTSQNIMSAGGILDPANTSQLVNSLEKISNVLEDIRATLGTIDDNNGFKNLVTSIDELLGKLEAIQSKVGTGVYNVQVHQGVSREALSASQASDSYIRDTYSRYANAFQNITAKAGSEEILFSYINSAINIAGGIDALQEAFGSINVAQINSSEERIQRLMKFFGVLREAMQSPYFGLDLKGVKLPASDDATFRSKLKEMSLSTKTGDELTNLTDDTAELSKIVNKLEEIRDLLNQIVQNNSLNELFTSAADKLNELLIGLKNIGFVSDESNILRELKQELEGVAQAIRNKNELFEAEDNIVFGTINSEIEVLETLRQKIDNVVQAVRAKNNEFEIEGTVATQSIQKEIDALTELKNVLSGQLTSQGAGEELDSFKQLKDIINDIQSAIDNKTASLSKEIETAVNELPQEILLFESLRNTIEFISQRIAVINQGISRISSSGMLNDYRQQERRTQQQADQDRRRQEREEQQRQREAQRAAERRQREEQANINRQSRRVVQYYKSLERSEERYQNLLAKRNAGETLTQPENSRLVMLQGERDMQEQILATLQQETEEVIRERDEYEQLRDRAIEAARYSLNQKYINDITKNMRSLQAKIDSGKYTTFSSNVARQGLNDIRDNSGYLQEENVDALRTYISLLANLDKQLTKTANNTKLTKMLVDVNTVIADNSKMSRELMSDFRNLAVQIQDAIDTGAPAEQIQALSQRFLQLKSAMISTGQTGKSFINTIKNDISQASARMIAQYMSFQDWIRYIRLAIEAVMELDSALTQLKIVSGATDGALQGVARDAYTLANNLGMSTAEVVSSITEWRRLGKTIDESMILAEQAARLSTGGLMDINSATTALVSSMQAFEMGAEEASRIVDQYIYLGK